MNAQAFFYIHNVSFQTLHFSMSCFYSGNSFIYFIKSKWHSNFSVSFEGLFYFYYLVNAQQYFFCKPFNSFQWFKKCYHQMKIIAIIQGQRFFQTFFCLWIMITDVHQKELYFFYISNGSIYSHTNVSLLLEP